MWSYLWVALWIAAVVAAAVAEWQYHRYSKRISATGNPAEIKVTRLITLLCFFFERERMAWRASFCDTRLPKFLRAPLLRTISMIFGMNVAEAREPLEAYATVGDFFSRKLRKGLRVAQSNDPRALVSPVDATVLAVGVLEAGSSRAAQVEVKGTSYSLTGLLGVDPAKDLGSDSVLLYVAFHLGVGDYHRFHSPTSFCVREGRRFAGEGFPVMPLVTGLVSDVFSMNERLVLSGDWSGGHLHMAAVGAAHVRGIFLDFDTQLAKDLVPTKGRYYLDGQCTTSSLPGDGKVVSPAAMLGGFRLGSAVVIVCEAPKGSRWNMGAGDRVQVGETLLSWD